MISNLPLLFANGYPSSLEKMTRPQLERFVPFMVQCSLGHDTATEINLPIWWPKDIPFTNPCSKPDMSDELWCKKLKKLIEHCYSYHQSDFLLRFCTELAHHPPNRLKYVDNWDSTTSLFHKTTGKLLVTFRNENMMYDKRVPESPRKCLLPRVNHSRATSGTEMVHTTAIDIYFCDHCDLEFDSLMAVELHGRICGQSGDVNSRPSSPEILDVDQAHFLRLFGLQSQSSMDKPIKPPEENGTGVLWSPKKITRSAARRGRSHVPLTRYPAIPFSSYAGIALAKRMKSSVTEAVHMERLERTERYCYAPPLSQDRPRWLDKPMEGKVYASNFKKNSSNWSHLYTFPDSLQKHILSIGGQIMLQSCRKVSVSIARLTEKDIMLHTMPNNRISNTVVIDDDDIEMICDKSVKRILENRELHVTVDVNKSKDKKTLCNNRKTCVDDVIDLCSSDEESECEVNKRVQDENTDPRSCLSSGSLQNVLSKKQLVVSLVSHKREATDSPNSALIRPSKTQKLMTPPSNSTSLESTRSHIETNTLVPPKLSNNCTINTNQTPQLQRSTRSNDKIQRRDRTSIGAKSTTLSPLSLPSCNHLNLKTREQVIGQTVITKQ